MTHIQLQNKFAKKLEKYLDIYFYYKIPDCPGGPLRPFDSFLIYRSAIYVIEFKVGRDTLKRHQKYFLDKAHTAGATAMLITDKDNLDDVIVNRITYGGIKECLY